MSGADNNDLPEPTIAAQVSEGDQYLTLIHALRVLILEEDSKWFAQGLEIDYAAIGDSLEQAQRNFEAGLYDTITEYLTMHGDIGGLLKVAPDSAWRLFLEDPLAFKYSQVSYHETNIVDRVLGQLKMTEIAYLQKQGIEKQEPIGA